MMDALRQAQLETLISQYDPQVGMIASPAHYRPSHSRLPEGTVAHHLQESLELALLLLQLRDDAESRQIANDIIKAVLQMEGRDPTTTAFGLWPWMAEEPLHAMVRMDGNWSEFIGARLAQLLHVHADQLDAEVLEHGRDALGDAALAIFRRNVGAYYTNIALSGCVATLAAGEMLDDHRMLHYGRRRLERAVEHHAYHDNFNEYNSSTYLPVTIWELERLMMIVHDAQARELAQTMLRKCWQSIANHWHAPTAQLAGPISRAYHDRLVPAFVAYLSQQLGVDLTVHPTMTDSSHMLSHVATITPYPVEPDILERILHPKRNREIAFSAIRRERPEHCVHGVTCHRGDACLGSINQGSQWAQRRNVLGYWRSQRDPAAMMRVRLLIDGSDIATGYLLSHQMAMHVLCGLEMHTDLGVGHLLFDHPEDGIFRFSDLRLRVELNALDAGVRPIETDQPDIPAMFELHAEPWRCLVTAAVSRSGLGAVTWSSCNEGETSCVDAVIHSGKPIAVPLDAFAPLQLAMGLTVCKTDEPYTASPIRMDADIDDAGDAKRYRATWAPAEDVQLTITPATVAIATGYHPMGEPDLPKPEPMYRMIP